MSRGLIAIAVGVLLVLVLAPAALAVNQPSKGISGDTRNPAGFGGGPHCHVIAVDNAQTQWDFIVVYPSHTGHANAGNDIFNADGDCDGEPG
jgi:hypothetical protein